MIEAARKTALYGANRRPRLRLCARLRLDASPRPSYTSAAPEMDVILNPCLALGRGGDDRGFSRCRGAVN